MKNIITAIMVSCGFVFATAQKLPPRPAHPSHPAHPAHPKHSKKKFKKHKKVKPALQRPALMTPDGQKFRLGDVPPAPKRRPHLPPRPPRP